MTDDKDGRFDGVNVHTPETLAKREQTTQTTDMVVLEQLGKRKKTLTKLLSGVMDSTKFQTVALTTIRTSEKLSRCSPVSLVTAVMMAAQRGLSLDPTLGHAYLVPYAGEAAYQTGYQGKVFLAKRDGDVVVDSFVVYENDTFTIRRTAEGDEFEHIPTPLGQDPGVAVGYVARGRLPDGRSLFEVMRKADVEKIRDTVTRRYKGKETPAWREWFDEMGRGKAVNRLAKYLPQCPTLQLDAAQETALEGGDARIIDIEAEDGTLEPLVVRDTGESEGTKSEKVDRRKRIDPKVAKATQVTPEAPQTAESDDTAKDTPQPQNGAQDGEDGDESTDSGPVTARGALGHYIRDLRKGAGINQKELADGIGVSPSTMGRLETGKSGFDRGTVIAIAHYLDVMADDLLAVGGFPVDEGSEVGQGSDDASEPPQEMFNLQSEADQHVPQEDE